MKKPKTAKRTAKSFEAEIEALKERIAYDRELYERENGRLGDRIHTLETAVINLTKDLTVAKGSETSLRLKLTKSREELDKLLALPREELKRVQIFQEVGQALEILGLVRARLNGEDGPRPNGPGPGPA